MAKTKPTMKAAVRVVETESGRHYTHEIEGSFDLPDNLAPTEKLLIRTIFVLWQVTNNTRAMLEAMIAGAEIEPQEELDRLVSQTDRHVAILLDFASPEVNETVGQLVEEAREAYRQSVAAWKEKGGASTSN